MESRHTTDTQRAGDGLQHTRDSDNFVRLVI